MLTTLSLSEALLGVSAAIGVVVHVRNLKVSFDEWRFTITQSRKEIAAIAVSERAKLRHLWHRRQRLALIAVRTSSVSCFIQGVFFVIALRLGSAPPTDGVTPTEWLSWIPFTTDLLAAISIVLIVASLINTADRWRLEQED